MERSPEGAPTPVLVSGPDPASLQAALRAALGFQFIHCPVNFLHASPRHEASPGASEISVLPVLFVPPSWAHPHL